ILLTTTISLAVFGPAWPTIIVAIIIVPDLVDICQANMSNQVLCCQKWRDYRLQWDPEEYGNISCLRIPSTLIWLPDIVLENKSLFIGVSAPLSSPTSPSIGKIAPWCSSESLGAPVVNGEWAIKHRPAKKVVNAEHFTPSDIGYQQIVFFLIIQRKPLFYVVNIIIPCVLISSVALLVYFLPAKAGGQKYLTFLLGVTIAIVVNAVIVLNVSLRTPNTHSMSERIRQVFLHLVPRYLGMHMRRISLPAGNRLVRRRSSLGLMAKAEEYMLWKARREGLENGGPQDFCNNLRNAAPEIQSCVNACNHITKTLQEKNNFD
ncbi:Acetylcholine receptor subunit gamma, partial [Ophiophagus hannah]